MICIGITAGTHCPANTENCHLWVETRTGKSFAGKSKSRLWYKQSCPLGCTSGDSLVLALSVVRMNTGLCNPNRKEHLILDHQVFMWPVSFISWNPEVIVEGPSSHALWDASGASGSEPEQRQTASVNLPVRMAGICSLHHSSPALIASAHLYCLMESSCGTASTKEKKRGAGLMDGPAGKVGEN